MCKEKFMSFRILVASLFMLLISITYAQRMTNPLSVGPQVGYYKASDADNPGVMSGATLRLRLGGPLAVEASVNYRKEYYQNKSISLKSWPVLITALLYPVRYIYGMAGVGWYNTRIAYSKDLNTFGDKSSQKFGWHLGAGVEMPFTKKVKLATDFRYTFLNYDFDVPGTDNLSSNYFIISAGLFFKL
jgi:opacity protein-like surface antigen